MRENLGQPGGTQSTRRSEWLPVAVAIFVLAGLVWGASREPHVASISVDRIPPPARSLPIPLDAIQSPSVSDRNLAVSAGPDTLRKASPQHGPSHQVVGGVPLTASSLPYAALLPPAGARSLEAGGGTTLGEGDVASGAATDQVSLLVIEGSKTNNRDVRLKLSKDAMTLLPTDGGAPLTVMPYRDIAKVTYIHARDPRWDPALPAPSVKINVPGIFGRARHWLVVQTRSHYAILQLDKDRSGNFLQTFELRTGAKIDRPTRNVG